MLRGSGSLAYGLVELERYKHPCSRRGQKAIRLFLNQRSSLYSCQASNHRFRRSNIIYLIQMDRELQASKELAVAGISAHRSRDKAEYYGTMITGEQMLVLLAGVGSVTPIVTVAQFLN